MHEKYALALTYWEILYVDFALKMVDPAVIWLYILKQAIYYSLPLDIFFKQHFYCVL